MSLSAEEIRADRIAIYIRWSTEDQGEGTTLDVQLEACEGFIMSQGWKFRQDLVFVDDGVSGASMVRPALNKLRAHVKQRLVDCVVVYKLDRLSRSVLDMLKLVLEEWDGLCAVKSAREPVDTMTPTGKMFFYQLMSFAEWERAVIRDRMFSGRLRRAQEGKNPGFVLPYGYQKGENGAIEQDPSAAPVIARIFQLYLTGLGIRMISKKLEAEGLPSPSGVSWSQGTLTRILSNPAYMGTFIYGRQKRVKGKRVAAKEPHVVKKDFFPPIVSKDEWDAVQQLKEARPSVGRSQGHGRTLGSQNLLTGLLKCTCGRSCHGIAPRLRGTVYRYYVCGAAQATGPHVCGAGNIRQEHLDTVVTEKLLGLYRGTAAKERILDQLVSEVRDAHQRAVLARQTTEQELRRLEESEKRLKGLFIDGKLEIGEYRELQAEVVEKLAAAREANREAVQAEAGAREALQRDQQNTVLLDRINEWEDLALVEQKQVLRQFVRQITVFRDKQTDEITCEIDWRWSPGKKLESGTVVIKPERSYKDLKTFAGARKRVGGRFVAAG